MRFSLLYAFIDKQRYKNDSKGSTNSSYAGTDDSLVTVTCFEVGLPPTGILPKLISSPSTLILGIMTLALIETNSFLPPLTIMVSPESIICYLKLINLTVTSETS